MTNPSEEPIQNKKIKIDLDAFQQEIDDKILKFTESNQTLNNSYFTRKDFKELQKVYILKMKEMIELYFYIEKNIEKNHEFYLKNQAKLIQEILTSTQTEFGKLFQQYYPSFRHVVLDRINFFSNQVYSMRCQSVKEVQDLTSFASRIQQNIK
jgi:hypothetical protein